MLEEKAKYEIAYEDYMIGMKYKDIAEKYDVSVATVKSWKTRHWGKKGMHTKPKKSMQHKKYATSKKKELLPSEKEIVNSIEKNTMLSEKQKLFCLYYIKSFNATQSYMKAYSCSYDTARVEGSNALTNPNIKNEIKSLKEIKNQSIMVTGDDVIELHMRIAFADITDYVDFKCKQTTELDEEGNSVTSGNEDEKEDVKGVNILNLKPSNKIDGQLISDISVGRETKIKLVDKQKSLSFLEKYFELNPMDRHKKEFDKQRLKLELIKVESEIYNNEVEQEDSKLINTLEESSKGLWANE